MITRRILIVDDDAELSQAWSLQLQHAGGFTVRVENHASAALATVREFQPHLIFMDVMMPGMDGGQLVALMREDQQLASIPVVFLTGSVRKEEVENRRGIIGGMPFLAKPTKFDDVLAWINKLVPLPS